MAIMERSRKTSEKREVFSENLFQTSDKVIVCHFSVSFCSSTGEPDPEQAIEGRPLFGTLSLFSLEIGDHFYADSGGKV